MNLLFLDSIESDVYGGMEEWIRLVASGLRERGHRIRVVGRPDSVFLQRMERDTQQIQLTPLEISGDFHPKTIQSLKNLLSEDETDIIITNFNKDLRLGGLAAKLNGRVKVVWSIGLDITKDSWIHRLLTPRLCDGILVPSEALKSQITRHGYLQPADVQVIPIGIPDTLLRRNDAVRRDLCNKFGMDSSATVAVTVGRFVDQKGHTFLIDAAISLTQQFPDLHFVWCGDGPLETQLRQRIEQEGLSRKIHLAGMLPDITSVLAGSDLMIHPSVEEPFGIAILEGMRAGLPIIASRIGGIPEVLGATGILVEPKKPSALVKAVSSIFANRATADTMGQEARQRFETQFSHLAMLNAIEQYFETMLHLEKRHG